VLKRILFTGGSGLLALNCALYLRNDFEVYLGLHSRIINLEGVNTCLLDLENEQALEKELVRIKPDILINAAGMTSVEECELKPKEAERINAIIPGELARLSKKLNIYFVHISTDHLFDGTKSFQTEEDIVSPLNVYGKTKAKGEQEVLKNNNEALIARTNFFGWGTNYRKSFSDYIIENLRLNNNIYLFDNVYYTPILISNFAKAISFLLYKKSNGIYNIVSKEKISKFEFSILICDQFRLNKNLLNKTKINNNLLLRPLDMSLSSSKFISNFSHNIVSIKNQISQLYDEEKLIKSELLTL
jgi:dTDP-4-dehydrorhamnose reductase